VVVWDWRVVAGISSCGLDGPCQEPHRALAAIAVCGQGAGAVPGGQGLGAGTGSAKVDGHGVVYADVRDSYCRSLAGLLELTGVLLYGRRRVWCG
jgi:hypothetical protein